MMYERIINTMAALTAVGLVFITWAIPQIANDDSQAEPLGSFDLPTMPRFTAGEVLAQASDEAAILKSARETAESNIAAVSAIFDTIDTVEPELERLTYVGEFFITMYAATVEQCGNDLGITASGRKVTDDPKCHTVAVDPAVIPLGSYLIIEGYDGIIFRADDTGSAINGYDIDIFTTSESESKTFNNLSGVKVWIIEEV